MKRAITFSILSFATGYGLKVNHSFEHLDDEAPAAPAAAVPAPAEHV